MNLHHHFVEQFAYEHWANERLLYTIETHFGSIGKPLDLFSHLLAAHTFWYEKVTKHKMPIDLWESLDVKSCIELNRLVTKKWTTLVYEIDENAFLNAIDCIVNHEHVSLNMKEMMTHLLLHSAQIRGQITEILKASNENIPSIDYLLYIKEMSEA
jgi:uncharacterized damage-inducible protein DinB